MTDATDTLTEVDQLRQEVAFLNTWPGLMSTLDRQYPKTGTTPHVVGVIREVEQLRTGRDAVLKLCAEHAEHAGNATYDLIAGIRDAYQDGAGL